MPKFAERAFALFFLLLLAAGTGAGATTNDFYLSMLNRGIANFEAGEYEAAVRELDVAAFGLIESIDHFERAKAYSAIANDKLGRPAQARAAAQRILAAERVQRRFTQVALPADVRTAFLAVARKGLSTAEFVALSRESAPIPPSANQPRIVQQQIPSTTRAPIRNTPATPQPPQVAGQQPPAQQPSVTPPSTTVPAPQNSSATKPEPQIEQPRPVVPEQKPLASKPVTPVPTQPAATPQETPRRIEETVITFPPEPEPVRPQPNPEVPKADPPQPQPKRVDSPRPAPAPPVQTTTRAAPRDIPARLAAAERLLGENDLIGSREIYREVLDAPALDHATILAIGEGLYRARDFAAAVRAFERAGTLRSGEEPYRYYLAVALYETGSYAKAKRELAAAMPYIEITPSVSRYRAKIEGAID